MRISERPLSPGHPAGEVNFQAEAGEGGEDKALPDLVAAGSIGLEHPVGQESGVGVEGKRPALLKGLDLARVKG